MTRSLETTGRSGRVRRLMGLGLVALLAGCMTPRGRVLSPEPPDLADEEAAPSPYLKAHMLDGSVFVFRAWTVDEDAQEVSGLGEHLDANRRLLGAGDLTLSLDEVALFETNEKKTPASVAALAVVTGVSLGITVACIANPKACFGSCPTFYTGEDEDAPLVAEGFSSSVAPALEAADVDALPDVVGEDGQIVVHMRNEALETHVIRHVDLLAVPRVDGRRVMHTPDDRFYDVGPSVAPTICAADEGSCLDAVVDYDWVERVVPTDEDDLAAREQIVLRFQDPPEGRLGLAVGARQSLVSTFLFYGGLSAAGSSATEVLAWAERRDGADHPANRIFELLGGIEVLVEDGGDWRVAGRIEENGPLARNLQLVPLGITAEGPVEVRLRLPRGGWRLDHVALVDLGEAHEPVRIGVDEVTRDGEPAPEALASLRDPEQVLVAMPGDAYRLVYRPPDEPSELFLESRGYYLEWMRDEWVAEDDPALALTMMLRPRHALRTLAPEFKQIESQMDALFWGSRYVRQ